MNNNPHHSNRSTRRPLTQGELRRIREMQGVRWPWQDDDPLDRDKPEPIDTAEGKPVGPGILLLLVAAIGVLVGIATAIMLGGGKPG